MEHNPIQIPAPDVLAVLPPSLIADAIDALIGALDAREGDPDEEDEEGQMVDLAGRYIGPEPDPSQIDDADQAWPEWHTLGRHKDWRTQGLDYAAKLEDSEDDDPAEDDSEDRCAAGDDDLSDWGLWASYYPDRGAGDDADAEASAWVERVNQTRDPRPISGWSVSSIHEDDESAGDDQDGNPAEDEFMQHAPDGPGCPISDPDRCAVELAEGTAGLDC